MIDRKWIKNLAKATYTSSGWQLDSQSHPRHDSLLDELKESISSLYEECFDSIEAYNSFANESSVMRLLPLAPVPGKTNGGFMILLAHQRINVEMRDTTIACTAITSRGFQCHKEEIDQYRPKSDVLGVINWYNHLDQKVSFEIIVKTLMEKIVRMAFLADDIHQI